MSSDNMSAFCIERQFCEVLMVIYHGDSQSITTVLAAATDKQDSHTSHWTLQVVKHPVETSCQVGFVFFFPNSLISS